MRHAVVGTRVENFGPRDQSFFARSTRASVLLVADASARNRILVDRAAKVHTVVLWDADKLLKQLDLGEDSRVEFMEVFFSGSRVREPRRERIANELAAFGNTLGGALIFSVSDAGEVRPMSRGMMDALEGYVSEICADSIHPPLEFTAQRLALPDGSPTLVVDVERSPLVHRSPGGYLSRQGSSTRELSPEALRRLFQRRGRSGLLGPDEEIVAGTGLNTLEAALVDRFISSRARQADETQLAKLGLGSRRRLWRSPRNCCRSPALHRAPRRIHQRRRN